MVEDDFMVWCQALSLRILHCDLKLRNDTQWREKGPRRLNNGDPGTLTELTKELCFLDFYHRPGVPSCVCSLKLLVKQQENSKCPNRYMSIEHGRSDVGQYVVEIGV